ncbi:rh142.3 [macacine betaherpesvirus 3]|uniref:Rh142.3 n=1 Tax=Rhesus cytomegalovirus (strain 68-1) TaxID=47929 RepID=Q2FAG5_RHCM6|nr:rh142.3 [macacine betaherpesvirus 3]
MILWSLLTNTYSSFFVRILKYNIVRSQVTNLSAMFCFSFFSVYVRIITRLQGASNSGLDDTENSHELGLHDKDISLDGDGATYFKWAYGYNTKREKRKLN